MSNKSDAAAAVAVDYAQIFALVDPSWCTDQLPDNIFITDSTDSLPLVTDEDGEDIFVRPSAAEREQRENTWRDVGSDSLLLTAAKTLHASALDRLSSQRVLQQAAALQEKLQTLPTPAAVEAVQDTPPLGTVSGNSPTVNATAAVAMR